MVPKFIGMEAARALNRGFQVKDTVTSDKGIKTRPTSKTNPMSNKSSSSSSSGIGFSGLLTVLFIGLKLTGHITWPWVWVLSPLWISALIGLTILAIVLVIAIAAGEFK
jgi:hypothetical protein